jgi:hypothetical protein
MEKRSDEFDAIRRALKRIDHSDDRERAIGAAAEAALERVQRRLSELENANTMELPPTWNGDALSAFLDNAQKNTYATFHRKKPAYSLLQKIDDSFSKISTNLINPKNQIARFSSFARFPPTARRVARLWPDKSPKVSPFRDCVSSTRDMPYFCMPTRGEYPFGWIRAKVRPK